MRAVVGADDKVLSKPGSNVNLSGPLGFVIPVRGMVEKGL